MLTQLRATGEMSSLSELLGSASHTCAGVETQSLTGKLANQARTQVLKKDTVVCCGPELLGGVGHSPDAGLGWATEIHAQPPRAQLQGTEQAWCAKAGISSLSQPLSSRCSAFSEEWCHVGAIFSLEQQQNYNCTSGIFPDRLYFKLHSEQTSQKKNYY